MRQKEQPLLFAIFVPVLRLEAIAFPGPAMVAHIRRMVVHQKGCTDASFRDGVTFARSCLKRGHADSGPR